ncbi:Ribosomal L5P family protein [Hibiscus syriacus]|uniref:Ribosomal L5P family protein n=1 Tax=Hibiscus syriacus TaxID=106335 RepID=A0A6A3CAA5_HIBSY|nr:Ribosomal L5P family protein [Hibiscus syriacus]
MMSPGIENSEQSCNTHDVNKPTAVPAVLTCHLEKSILSGSIGNDPVLPPAIEGQKIIDAQTEKQEVNVDDHASQHLLSLLENNTRKSLTLEALFGSAFMKELQSVGAPASIHRGSASVDVLESNGLPLHVTDDSVLPSTVHIWSNKATFETNIIPFSQIEHIKSDGIEEHFLGYNDARSLVAVGSSHLRDELGPRGGDLNRSTEIQLPKEDVLIGVSNPGQLHNFMSGNVEAGQFHSQETPLGVAEKLAALKGVFRDERAVVGQQEGPVLLFFLIRSQLNHGGPLIHLLDSRPSNIDPQMKFIAPEGILHRDTGPNHQFPASMLRPPFHHPTSGPSGFDPPMCHPMLEQMPVPGNFPPPHLQRGFPRGAPLPPHMDIQEVNPMHGFPFGRQTQPNFAGLGMPPGHDAGSGSHHPEALQRLMEMQLRSNSKQMSPFGAASNSQGMYDHGHIHNLDLNMDFGYR